MSSKGIVEARKQLKNAFLASYIFGAAVLTFFLWGVEPGETASRFWALTCSLVPMGLYIGYGRSLSPKHRDDAGFADSVYYLGFMFTLTSLFLAINVKKDNAVNVEEQILQYFGVALATTIVGIIYRTYHTQFLQDDSALPKGEAERISAEVDQFSDAMEVFRGAIGEMSKTINEDLNSNYGQLSENIQSVNSSASSTKISFDTLQHELENNLKNLTQPFGDAVQKISDDLNNQNITIDRSVFYELEEEMKKVNLDFQASIRKVSDELNEQKINQSIFTKLSKNLDNLTIKFQTMNTKLDNMVTAYNSALTKMNEHNMEAMKKVRKLNKELDKASGTRKGWFG